MHPKRYSLFFLMTALIVIFASELLSVYLNPSASANGSVPSFTGGSKYVPLSVDPGTYQLSFTDPDTGDDMNYYVYVPELARKDMPLIIFLHGIGEVNAIHTIKDNPLITSATEIYGNAFPAIILAPNTKMSSWINSSVCTTLKALIDQVVDTYHIDRSKIIITGHSMGGSGVYKMVELHGDYFSAAVVISPPNPESIAPEHFLTVPMRSFADRDEICDWTMVPLAEQIRTLGGDTIHTTLEGYTHAKTPYGAYTRSLFQWMIEQ